VFGRSFAPNNPKAGGERAGRDGRWGVERDDLLTTEDGGVIMYRDFLDLMNRAATYAGLTGDDRAAQWMRRHGVSGELAVLTPADVSRLAEIATGIIRRKHARDAKRYPPVPPPEPTESAKGAGRY